MKKWKKMVGFMFNCIIYLIVDKCMFNHRWMENFCTFIGKIMRTIKCRVGDTLPSVLKLDVD